MYHHITNDQCVALAALLRAGYSQRNAAKELGINQSSVSRELKRNRTIGGSYHAAHAALLARARRKESKCAYRKIEHDQNLQARIVARLHPLISPEVIAHDEAVSHETIYAWIYRSRPDLKVRLPQRGKKRRHYGSKRQQKQGWTRNVRSIELRSQEAVERSAIGHFEGDTVRGKSGALLTLTDRKSRYEFAMKLEGERCDPVYNEIARHRKRLHARSFTFDRGSAFSLWQMIECATGAQVYFAHPRAP